jgi:hypothetical protein
MSRFDETDVHYQHRYKHTNNERAEKTGEECHKTIHLYGKFIGWY